MIIKLPIETVRWRSHTPLDTTIDGARLALQEVVAGLGAQQDKDLL